MKNCIYEGKIAEIAIDLRNLREHFQQFRENDFHEIKETLNNLTEKVNTPHLPLWVTWLLAGISGLVTALVVLMLKG